MKYFAAVFLVMFCDVFIATALNNNDIKVVSEYDHRHDGEYDFGYKLSDEQTRVEGAVLKDVGQTIVLAVTGSYSFVGPDGRTYRVEYISDERGYRAKVRFNAQNIPNFEKKMVSVPKDRIPLALRTNYIRTKTTQRPKTKSTKNTIAIMRTTQNPKNTQKKVISDKNAKNEMKPKSRKELPKFDRNGNIITSADPQPMCDNLLRNLCK